VAFSHALIEATRFVGPPMFFGNPGASIPSVVAFWVVFYVWLGSELWLGYRLRRASSGAADQDAGSKFWVIASVWASVAIGMGLAFAFPDAAILSGRTVVFIAGLFLMVAGMALRWYSIRVLGSSFTCEVATRPGQEVVEAGPYRWVRHPSYTGGLITVLGVLLCCSNVVSLAALIVAVAGYANRIHIEERALAKDLGDPYRAYMRRTKRLIPFVV
jgi:protein-S-isoprenylcysteine O-methyltransferase Ste14